MTGTAGQKRVPNDYFAQNPFPLAPLEEQKRIVARVDELMKLCDELEARQQARCESRVRLNKVTLAPLNNPSLAPEEFGRAADHLANNFAVLYDSAETVDLLRSTILQLAVQGKLVPHDVGEESATPLLRAIEAKRKELVSSSDLKKLTPTRVFDPDKSPLSLPQGWDWTQLGRISLKLGAGSTPPGGRSVYREEGVKFIRSQNVWNDGLRLDGIAFISEETHEDMSGTQVEPGDVLLNITGASIGRSSIAPEDIGEANVSQHVSIIRLVDKRLRFFIHLCVISPYFQRSIMQTQVGISREGLSMKSLKEFVLPIPPLEEQDRIVAKVNQLVALCDELEAKLRKADSDSEKAMNAAVRHVLSSAAEPPILTGASLS
jgi:type I restriction enzyme S subunit